MTKKDYIEAIIEMLEKCNKESTLEFIYVLLKKSA